MHFLVDLGYIRSLAGIVAMMIPVMSIAGRIGIAGRYQSLGERRSLARIEQPAEV